MVRRLSQSETFSDDWVRERGVVLAGVDEL